MIPANAWKPLFLSSLLLICGCTGKEEAKAPVKAPRPVSVIRLAKVDPSSKDRLTGSVGSWKTEALGFEVSGRVRYVIEPETDVQGQLYRIIDNGTSQSRTPFRTGQVLATLDDTRYQLAVASVKAQIETAIQQKKATSIEVAKVIPAQRAAAEADRVFRKSELDRNTPLLARKAVSQADFDKIKAQYDASVAELAQVDASLLAKQAEEASLQARIDELNETLAQAERDVADCKLRSPFQGQVAKVEVIPGGVVQKGQPVVTVQMMDPIKIELEVSAARSRMLNYRDIVRLSLDSEKKETTAEKSSYQSTERESTDGESTEDKAAAEANTEEAFVYSIDPVADPQTRTFTVTLLMRNRKVQSPPPPGFEGPVVRARDIWELMKAPDIRPGARFVEAGAIHSQGDEHYVWKINNRQEVAEKKTAVLDVSKVKVTMGDLHVDWLGLWTFREISIVDGEDFDLDADYVAGSLDTKDPFEGDKILLDRQRWLVRPGDLVGVDLAGGRQSLGFFAPMDAIHGDGGKSYVFQAENGRVKRIEVNVFQGPNTLKRIEAASDPPLVDGMQLVAGGVHYVIDGEEVNVVEEVKVKQ